MASNIWAALGGNEIINATRVEQYARSAGMHWLKPVYENAYLPLMLGDGDRYTTPLQDNAPWVDPDNPYSWEFLGVYPVEITGLEDSTRTAELIQYTTDGGSVGRIRHATKPVVFNVLLVATSEAGAEYGFQWLKQVTLNGPCGDSYFGGDLCYLSSNPMLDIPDTPATLAQIDGGLPDSEATVVVDGGDPSTDPDESYDGGDPSSTTPVIEHSTDIFEVPPPVEWDPEDCLVPYLRTARRFSIPSGPSIMQKYGVSSGALWAVQFAGTAGVPWEFSAEVDVITGFLGPDPQSGVAIDVDTDGYVAQEAPCMVQAWEPLYDPLCPALIAPPGPADVPLGCLTLPSSWLRRQMAIPKEQIPLWGEVVPILSFHTGDQDLRTMRVRFYSDPDELRDPSVDPCTFCGDVVVSYIPANSTLVFDAASETVYVDMPGGIRRRADSLVFGSDQKPFEWPALSCGFSYVVTLDLPQTQTPPVMDLALVPRSK